jgi:hypothetical protein
MEAEVLLILKPGVGCGSKLRISKWKGLTRASHSVVSVHTQVALKKGKYDTTN